MRDALSLETCVGGLGVRRRQLADSQRVLWSVQTRRHRLCAATVAGVAGVAFFGKTLTFPVVVAALAAPLHDDGADVAIDRSQQAWGAPA